jgi:PadR family transcriptional regulator PadR
MAKTRAKPGSDLLQGTLDLLILKALQRGGPMHGYGISVLIRQWSDEMLRVEQGSLYPALYRLEEQGWVATEWGTSDNNRRAKFYRVTRAGLKQLRAETQQWRRLSGGVNLVLQEI